MYDGSNSIEHYFPETNNAVEIDSSLSIEKSRWEKNAYFKAFWTKQDFKFYSKDKMLGDHWKI